jgi:hypothetical protein
LDILIAVSTSLIYKRQTVQVAYFGSICVLWFMLRTVV